MSAILAGSVQPFLVFINGRRTTRIPRNPYPPPRPTKTEDELSGKTPVDRQRGPGTGLSLRYSGRPGRSRKLQKQCSFPGEMISRNMRQISNPVLTILILLKTTYCWQNRTPCWMSRNGELQRVSRRLKKAKSLSRPRLMSNPDRNILPHRYRRRFVFSP